MKRKGTQKKERKKKQAGGGLWSLPDAAIQVRNGIAWKVTMKCYGVGRARQPAIQVRNRISRKVVMKCYEVVVESDKRPSRLATELLGKTIKCYGACRVR